MISRIVYAALIAGIGGGLLLFLMQNYQLLPLLQEAERYRLAATMSGAGIFTEPSGIYQITRQTLALNILAATAFALLLALVMWLKQRAGFLRGLGLGILGYLAFYVVPSLAHQPTLNEISPSDAANLDQWWLISASCTWIGMVLILLVPNRLLKLFGIAVFMSQFFYLPDLTAELRLIPAELGREFVLRLYIVNALLWLVLGALTGTSFSRHAYSRDSLSQ